MMRSAAGVTWPPPAISVLMCRTSARAAFNRQAFDEFPDEQRGAVRQAAAAAITRGHVVGRAHGDSKEALGLLGQRLNVVALSAAQRRSWCLAARPVVVEALEKALRGPSPA